jgi:hypothetical protein
MAHLNVAEHARLRSAESPGCGHRVNPLVWTTNLYYEDAILPTVLLFPCIAQIILFLLRPKDLIDPKVSL